MPYYDRLAKQWHQLTGHKGGALKSMILNQLIWDRIDGIGGLRILELGAGNGYLMPLLLREFSGQQPERIVVSDISSAQLANAKRHFSLSDAEYLVLDARNLGELGDAGFDLIVASMVFNEITGGFGRAVSECRRVMAPGGQLLAAVVHPKFVSSLDKRGELKHRRGLTTMPGSSGTRWPVVKRSAEGYCKAFRGVGFEVESVDVLPNDKLLRAKPGLKKGGRGPLALLLDCRVPG